MNREVLESNWAQIREILSEKFNNLSDEDIRQINGRYDQLVAKLQQKYGYTREEAEERIRNWNFDRLAYSKAQGTHLREDSRLRDDRLRREEADTSWSLSKWLLALGIPLLLLATYFLSRTPETTTTTPVVTQERIMTETPADRAISNGLRNAFLSQQNIAFDLQNVRIATHNGVVTLSGTVPSQDIRNAIGTTALNYPGVRQVVNNIQVQ